MQRAGCNVPTSATEDRLHQSAGLCARAVGPPGLPGVRDIGEECHGWESWESRESGLQMPGSFDYLPGRRSKNKSSVTGQQTPVNTRTSVRSSTRYVSTLEESATSAPRLMSHCRAMELSLRVTMSWLSHVWVPKPFVLPRTPAESARGPCRSLAYSGKVRHTDFGPLVRAPAESVGRSYSLKS
jgi:hypothetical protein